MNDDTEHEEPKTGRPKTGSANYLANNGGVPLDHPRRCQGTATGTGEPCRKYAIKGGNVCRTHGGSAPQVLAKADERLKLAADRMARNLLNIAEGAKSEHVQYLATTAALDRAGVVPATKVNVDLNAPWAEVLQGITGIAQISQAESRARRGLPDDPPALSSPDRGDIVDAEVVEEPPSGPPASRTGGDRADVTPQPGTGLQTMEDALEDLRRSRKRSW